MWFRHGSGLGPVLSRRFYSCFAPACQDKGTYSTQDRKEHSQTKNISRGLWNKLESLPVIAMQGVKPEEKLHVGDTCWKAGTRCWTLAFFLSWAKWLHSAPTQVPRRVWPSLSTTYTDQRTSSVWDRLRAELHLWPSGHIPWQLFPMCRYAWKKYCWGRQSNTHQTSTWY